MENRREMTDAEIYEELEAEEERFAEQVWDNLQRGSYVVVGGSVFDYATGDFICNLKILQ
uniref:hypothetical protein n=1 Tax=Acetatifactor sp. TaxID=1872090 RepID=UPI0040565104